MSGAPAHVPDLAPGMLRRLASMLYESILLFAVAFIGTWVFQFAAGTLVIDGWRRHLLMLFLVVLFGIYFVWCWRRGGQTLPMKTWRIRVVSRDGHRNLSSRQALLRYACAWLLPFSILWAMVDRDRQFLHDRLAGSLLVPVP